jgi:hypothetical protein
MPKRFASVRSRLARDGGSRVDLVPLTTNVQIVLVEPRELHARMPPIAFIVTGGPENARAWFDWLLDEPEAAVADKSVKRRSIALWWVKLPLQTVARCYDLGPRGHFVSLSVPEHYERTETPVERALWKFHGQHAAMAWSQNMGLMLEPTAGGVQ